MNLDLQFKIKNDKNLLNYLRQNSNWYKYLNRNPASIVEMEKEMKESYQLRAEDKLRKFGRQLEMISTFLDVLN